MKCIGSKIAPIFMVLSLAAVFPACGKNLKELTEAQKKQLTETLESSGNVNRMAMNQRDRQTGVRGLELMNLNRHPALRWAAGNAGDDIEANTTVGRMSNAIESGDCKVAWEGSQSSITNMALQIEGDKCPVTMKMSLAGKSDDQKAEFEFACAYKVRDKEFEELNDIHEGDLKGHVKTSLSPKGSTGTLFMDMDIKGNIHSKKYGKADVKLTSKLKGQYTQSSMESEGETVFEVEYSDFIAQLKQVVKDGKSTYFLNNKEVSEEEFMEFFQKGAIPTSSIRQ